MNMAFKVVVGLILISLVAGSYIADHALHAPKPYKFGYNIKDHHGVQYRHEESDGHGGVRGSYGFTDARGIYREVHYVADHGGFRATVKTNEPGTANQDPAAVHIQSSAHPHHYHDSHVPVQSHVQPIVLATHRAHDLHYPRRHHY